MNIYIMSRGRAGKVNTLKWISKEWRPATTIICSAGEGEEYWKVYGEPEFVGTTVIEAPDWVTNYSQKFQWLLNGIKDTDPKAVIIDDDLVFSSKSSEAKPDSLVTIRDPNELDNMWVEIECALDRYALVGVHSRQGGHQYDGEVLENGRIICLQGVNRSKIGRIKVDQHPILADVVLNCTLLSRGIPNAILTTFFQDHGPCQAPGGCSIYRTADMQRAAVNYLADRFPGYVKAVERRPKTAKWLGDVRWDYRCQWKELYRAGHDWSIGLEKSPDKEQAEQYVGGIAIS